MSTSFRILIRRFVLITSFPPFINIYRLFYKLVIRLAIRIFRKYPDIKAVYLRRGSAKGEILPLISDIDFSVIVNGMNEDNKKELLGNYVRLVKTTTIPDKTLEIYNEETFFNQYETNHYFQYRFMEGKKTWKLLYGKDYLADLPELSIEKMYGGFFTEIKVWWTIFEWRFFQNRKYNNESITRNNTCYKAISEILKMNLALNQGILEFDRKKVLGLSKHFFAGKKLNFLERLENISKKNYRSDESNILDESKNFILNYLDGFYREFENHPYAKSLIDKTQKVLCPKNEWLFDEEVNHHVNKLIHYAKENWSDKYKGSYLVPSVYFNVDEFLFMVKIDPEKIPTVKELTEFNLFHWKAKPKLGSRIKLFLLLPNAAFQIDTDDFKKSWQSVLCPSCNPDLFELLGRAEFKLDGEDYYISKFPVWTPPVEHFFYEEKMLFFELLENPSIYKLNNLDFLRIFWKTAQLVIMNRSVKKDEIVYPLTLPAIEEALIAENIALPHRLKILANAYRNELRGESDDIALLIPSAMNYLKEIA